jgi:hypothetical protein
MSETDSEPVVMIALRVPKSLARRVKVAAASTDQTQQQLLIAAVEEKLSRMEKPAEKPAKKGR